MQQIVDKKDSFQSWVVCLICLFVNVIVGGVGSSFGILTPSLEEYYNESPSLISFIGSLNMGMLFILDPLVAWLFLKFGLRTTYMTGSLIATISVIASTFSPSAQIMIILYGFFTGIGLACIELMAVIACDTSFEKRRAMASSIARGGIGIGGIILPPLVNSLLSHAGGWQVVLYMFSALFFIPFWVGGLTMVWDYVVNRDDNTMAEEKYKLIDKTNSNQTLTKYHSDSIRRLQELNLNLVNGAKEYSFPSQKSPSGVSNDIAMLMHAEKWKPRKCSFCDDLCDTCDDCIQWNYKNHNETNIHPIRLNEPTRSSNKSDTQVSKSLSKQLLVYMRSSLLWNPIFLLVMVGKFFGAMSYFIVTILFASLLLEKGFTLTEASNVASVVGATGIIGAILFGILTDRTKLNALTVSCFTMGLMSLTIISVTFTNQHELLWFFSICNGFVRNTFMSLGSVLMFDILPYEAYPTAVAYSSVFQGIGTMAGPPFAGYFYSLSHNYTISFCIAAVSALLCGILYSFANLLNIRKTKEINA